MPPAKASGSKSKAELLRKKQPHPAQSASEPNQQQTISDLFSTSKKGLKDRIVDDLPGPSPSKRMKTEHSTEQIIAPAQSRTIGADDMYNFSYSKPQPKAEVVDLTGSSNGSPMKKRLSGGVRPSTFASHTGPKKLVVKNLKNVSRPDPDQYYNRVWTQLDAALTAILSNDKLPYSMEELYKGVEFSCRQDRAPDLYKRLREKCDRGISINIKEPLLQNVGSSTDVGTLFEVVAAWSRWNKHLDTIRSIFFYLDRSYLLHSTQLPSLQQMGTNQFRDQVYSNPSVRPKVLQGACDLVGAERKGGQQLAGREALLQDAIKMFHGLSIYTKYFEPRLLSESEQYFCSWAEQAVGSNDLAGYVEMCDRLMAQEIQRSEKLGLEETTTKALQTYLEDILIDQRQNRLVSERDVSDLLANDRGEVLKQLFSLLQRRYLGEKLRQPFESYINKQGSDIVFDEEKEQEMVPRLLDFKRRLDVILEKSFQKHEGLGHSLREAFETFINKPKRSNMTWGTDNPKPGEMIAKHVDAVLKGGAKAMRSSGVGIEGLSKAADDEEGGESADEDVEITRSLDQVLDLFRFVHGKAVFEAFYKRDLARRLLLGRSASSDAEKSMLTRLKSECGAGFTHNLEQMFKDIEMAREEITSYKAMLEEREKRMPFDLSVNVLSASAWPTYPKVQVNVPEAILNATKDFETHYKTKHTGRKLEWKHALAHCQLKATLPKGNKEIVVSSFQAIVLLAFNSNESMSYADLQAFSGLGKSPFPSPASSRDPS